MAMEQNEQWFMVDAGRQNLANNYEICKGNGALYNG